MSVEIESLIQLCKSTDSFGSILLKENPLWNRHIKQYESPPKNRHLNTISKALISAVAEKKKKITNPINHSFRVKTAALLYEITERTNQLAQPRTRVNCNEKNSQGAEFNKIDRVLEASTRLIELAKPRVPFKPNLKPSFNVSPNALRAIATSRILELSKPRNKTSLKLHRKKKFKSYPTCSSRIEHLAKPRIYQEQAKRKFSKRKNLSSQTAKSGKNKSQRSSTRVKENLKKGSQNKKENRVFHSNSNRSVIVISSFDESVEKSKSRKNRRKSKKRGKLTWMRKYIENYPLSTLSNSSNHCVTSEMMREFDIA